MAEEPNPPITWFGGGRDGAFWAVHPRSTGRADLDTYHWTINGDCRSGRWYPSSAPMLLSTGLASVIGSPIAGMFEWENTSGEPLLIVFGGNGTASAKLYTWKDSTAANPSTIAQDFYTGGALYRYDQDATTDPDEEMAFFCNGYANDILVRRKKDGTVDTGATTPHTMKADGLWVVGSDLYASQGYKLLKLTAGLDPGLASSYPENSAGVPVGRPTWDINGVVALGAAPIVGKPEGLFKYNDAPSSAVFDPIFTVPPHPDNGKGLFTDGRGRVYYPTAHGDIIVATFGFQDSATPWRITTIDRNTPFGRITAFAADLDHVYAAVAPGSARTQDSLGLVVQSLDSGAFTDHTTNVTDRKFSTNADISALAGATDVIEIGSSVEPFLGAYVAMAAVKTGALSEGNVVRSITGDSNGASCVMLDGTLKWGRDGAIIFLNAEGDFSDMYTLAANPWRAASDADSNSVSAFWMTLAVGLTALTGAKIREVSLIPYRPPIDPDLFPMTAYKQGGALPSILVGTWVGERIVWQDVWTLPSPQVDHLLVARSHYAGATSEMSLYAMAGNRLLAMPIGPDGNPARAVWPKLADYGEAGTAYNEHCMMLSAWSFGAPTKVYSLVIEGEGLQSDDQFFFYYHWDNEDQWHKSGPHSAFPIVIENLNGRGRTLYGHFAFSDGSRDAVAPFAGKVIIQSYEIFEDDVSTPMGSGITSPQSL